LIHIFSCQETDHWRGKTFDVRWRRNVGFVFRILPALRNHWIWRPVLQNNAYFYQVCIQNLGSVVKLLLKTK